MNYSGKLLVAAPSLLDPNFQQTVVLLIHGNDEEGVFGLVLNRESDRPIRELWETIFHQKCATERHIHVGGPVFGPVFVLHSQPELFDQEVVPGVYFGSSKSSMDHLVEAGQGGEFRFFVGNAGWGEGQLAQEIEEGAWYLFEATSELVFAEETEIWEAFIEEVGRDVLGDIIQSDAISEDPSLN